jgi:formylglycine-generating enzyme required for sulfatase activity
MAVSMEWTSSLFYLWWVCFGVGLKTNPSHKHNMESVVQLPGTRVVFGDIPVRWIPPGRFMMGSPYSEKGRGGIYSISETQHEVSLTSGFFLAETECTQAQWEALMGCNPSKFKRADHPVELVGWFDAQEFCQNLTAKHQKEGVLSEGFKWRLPTEAEWEFAARAGSDAPYYGDLNEIAWYRGNSGGRSQPVKMKASNAWGLFDMLGNVSEWCADWNGEYSVSAETDPFGPKSGSDRVIRGGSWDCGEEHIRCAFRCWFDPDFRFNNIGFRLALGPIPGTKA